MKQGTSRVLALALASAMLLVGCGAAPEVKEEKKPEGETPAAKEETKEESKEDKKEASAEKEAITDLVLYRVASSELENFNILNSETSADTNYLTNVVDGLLEVDSFGRLVPAIAKEWGTEDGGLTWTFHLRDNVKWVDVNGTEKANCTAKDFATGLEWIMNFHKNDSANTTMPMEMIKGATEYYEYTKSLSQEEALSLKAEEGSKFFEMVGLELPDDYTLVYHCKEAKPYFDTLGPYSCLYPMAQGMVDELGIDGVRAMNNENMWYNGAYTMTSFIQGNEKVFTKNPMYWDEECSRFETVTFKMVESNDVAYQLYESEEVDEITLTESNIKTISSDPNHKYADQMIEWPADFRSYQFHLNYNKLNADGTPDENWNKAAANTAFRKSWYYGLDLAPYYSRTNAINPLSCENNFYTMKGLLYTSDGTEYTDLVKQELGLSESDGKNMIRHDAEKAQEYKKQAMEELSAQGVTFPINVDYYIKAGNQVALDTATVLGQVFADSLGEDYVKLNIKTYVSSASKEVYKSKLQSINISGWGADYGDPQNYLAQEAYGKDNAYYSRVLSNIDDVEENESTKELLAAYKEYTRMIEEADKINKDLDARYKAYAKAEAYLIDNCLTIPNNYNIGWTLTKINPYSKMKALFGIQNWKMKNWETSQTPYTTEEVQKLAEAHEASK